MPGRLSAARPRVGQVVLILLALVVLGGLAGVLWEWRWTPPSGIVSAHRFYLDEQGLPQEFSGTGHYVLVALLVGGAAGALVTLVFRTHALWTLGATVVGAGLASWTMAAVGHALGPPDPDQAALTMEDWAPLVSDLTVSGFSPYLCWPLAALTGLGLVVLADLLVGRFRDTPVDGPVTLEADPAA